MDRAIAEKELPIERNRCDAPSALDHTLGLSHEERLNSHQAAVELVLALQRAGQKYYAKQSKIST